MIPQSFLKTAQDTLVISFFIFSIYKLSDIFYKTTVIELVTYSLLFILLLPYYSLRKYTVNTKFLTSKCLEVIMLQFGFNLVFDYLFKLSDREVSYIPLVINLVIGFILSAFIYICYFFAIKNFKNA